MLLRSVASAGAVLATLAFGCSSSGESDVEEVREVVTSVATTLGAATELLGPSPSELVAAIVWPDGLVAVTLSADAQQDLARELAPTTRAAAFVRDSAAVGVGRGRDSVGAVLVLRLDPAAAHDASYRASLAEALVGPGVDDDATTWRSPERTVVWFDSTVVVVQAMGEDLAALSAAITAAR